MNDVHIILILDLVLFMSQCIYLKKIINTNILITAII